jgi:6-phosphogluconolactonase (cycloisomerase 2 family)
MTLALLALGAGVIGGGATAPHRAEAAAKHLFVYVHDRAATGQIFGFQMAADGNLTPLSGSPFPAGGGQNGFGGNFGTLTYSAQRKLLFAGAKDGVHVFRVAATGGLTEVAGSPFGGFNILGVTTVQKNASTFLYACDFQHDQVHGYRVAASGALTELPTSPYLSFEAPTGVAAVKGLAFVVNELFNTVSAFRVKGNGDLVPAPGSPYDVPAVIYNAQIDPQGKTLYVGDNSAKVVAFRVKAKDASLTPVPGSPFTTLATSAVQGTAPGKTRLVVAGGTSTDNLQVMRRLGNGALKELGGAQNSGSYIDGGCALDPKGKLLVLASNNGDHVKSFRLNQQTGSLTPADTAPATLTEVNAVAVIQR